MAFFIGQKVVCIEGDWRPKNKEAVPVKDQVYTIRELVDYGTGPSMRLVEIVNPPRQYTQAFAECCFGNECFRPLVDKKTDIGIFTALLTPSKRVLEEA